MTSAKFDQAESESHSNEYFSILDKDKDGVISFNDFITPYLPEITPEQA